MGTHDEGVSSKERKTGELVGALCVMQADEHGESTQAVSAPQSPNRLRANDAMPSKLVTARPQ